MKEYGLKIIALYAILWAVILLGACKTTRPTCAQLAGEKWKELREQGIPAEIVVCRMDSGELHAVVESCSGYHDPAFGVLRQRLPGQYRFMVPHPDLWPEFSRSPHAYD